MTALPIVVGTGWTSGLSAYGTVLALGLLGRFGVAEVPDLLTRTGVLIAAAVMFAIEFVVDKVPYADNLWDTIHTVVRPLIAGTIGVLFVGEADALEEAFAAAGSGGMALVSHAVKAGVRLVVNTSPEPLSTVAVSAAEDVAVGGVSYLTLTYPWVAFGIVTVLTALGVALLFAIRRRLRRFMDRWRRSDGVRPDTMKPNGS
jgi:hypothetical protein